MNSMSPQLIMGLLDDLFDNKKSVAVKLETAAEQRIELWRNHLANYPERVRLIQFFSPRNIEYALAHAEELDRVLIKLQELISVDLVNVKDEAKNDKEISKDLDLFTSTKSHAENDALLDEIADEEHILNTLLRILRKIHGILKIELHVIDRILRKKDENTKQFLLYLYKLIDVQEFRLYRVFKPREEFLNKTLYDRIQRIIRAVLLEQELKEEVETDEARFVREMITIMGKKESRHAYRKVGENIYSELAQIAAASTASGEDGVAALHKLEALIQNDRILYKTIKKIRGKYDDDMIKTVMEAFRKSFNLGHFDDLQGLLTT